MIFSESDRSSLISAARELKALGLMPGSQGNLSLRDHESGQVLITPHDAPYGTMVGDDLIVLSADGERVEGDGHPSYDAELHLTVYKHRPEVAAIIHTEPPYVTAFGAVGREIDPVTTTGLKSAGGVLPLAPFAYKRDAAFTENMLEIMGDRHAAIWASHGVLVVGGNLHQAMERTYGVEFNAKVLFLAMQLGKPTQLALLPNIGMVVA